MGRILSADGLRTEGSIGSGLTMVMVKGGIAQAYSTLDTIDAELLRSGSLRLSQLVELANLSSIIGNLVASGIVKASEGVFTRAGPHRYQDLRSSGMDPGADHIEIKVALEANKPKGHLAKPGPYLTCRYVLCDEDGVFTLGKANRGEVVWIWEVRFGYLEEQHFNISNTAGDSGKTAVVNQAGMEQLAVVYADRDRSPVGSAYWLALKGGDATPIA